MGDAVHTAAAGSEESWRGGGGVEGSLPARMVGYVSISSNDRYYSALLFIKGTMWVDMWEG